MFWKIVSLDLNKVKDSFRIRLKFYFEVYALQPDMLIFGLLHCSYIFASVHVKSFLYTLGHPSCLDMSGELVSVIQTYSWQCMECKTCTVCQQPHHEDEMMFCDKCDRGYHTFCVGMDSIPTGTWRYSCFMMVMDIRNDDNALCGKVNVRFIYLHRSLGLSGL